MTYEIQNRQIVECIEMELVLRVYDLQAFVIDQAVRSQNVQSQMSIWMRAAVLVPFSVDGSRVAVGVQNEAFV